jgi:hypothetical protein
MHKYSFPGIAVFLTGVTVGILSLRNTPEPMAPARRERGPNAARMPDSSDHEFKRLLADMESRLAAQETAASARFSHIEARLDQHSARLAEVPSISQIVAAMEQLISKSMASLDDRLTAQARSIGLLQTTVSQTGNLLEGVSVALHSLQASDSSDPAEPPLVTAQANRNISQPAPLSLRLRHP